MKYTITEIEFYLQAKLTTLTARKAEFTSVFSEAELEKEIDITKSILQSIEALKAILNN
jgi:hypothetical protein